MINNTLFIDSSFVYNSSMMQKSNIQILTYYYNLLLKAGIDIVEINTGLAHKLKTLRAENLSLRINSYTELKGIAEIPSSYVVTPLGIFLSIGPAAFLKFAEKRKIILEVHLENGDPVKRIQGLLSFADFSSIDVIRIKGLSTFLLDDLTDLTGFVSGDLNMDLDVCPENKNFCAAAISLKAIKSNVYSVSGSFGGFGGRHGYAPVEEVLLASKEILGLSPSGDMKVLSDLSRIFHQVTGINIPKNKPVIGENIFHCESGVHVDGILKAKETYEPYSPETVGLKREFCLGKHSGRHAIENILGISHEDQFPGILGGMRGGLTHDMALR